jgi:DNA-binding NtrC family response regulator
MPGYSPLVMVVDSDHTRRELTEAILAKLQFAVAPVDSVDKAISIAHALRPSVIVCPPADAAAIGSALLVQVPIVPIGADVAVTDALVEIVRGALRTTTVQ